MCMHKVLIFEKRVFATWIRTCDLQNASQLYPLSYMAVVFNGMLLNFSLLLGLQPPAECTHGYKLEVGG